MESKHETTKSASNKNYALMMMIIIMMEDELLRGSAVFCAHFFSFEGELEAKMLLQISRDFYSLSAT